MSDTSGMSADAMKERRRLLSEALVRSRNAEKEIIVRDQHEDDEQTERLARQIALSTGH